MSPNSVVLKKKTTIKGLNPVDIKSSRKLPNKKITGQGMSEYLIIVGLLAVAGIAVMGFMGSTVRTTFAGFAETLAGDTATAETNQDAAETAAQGATDNALVNLTNYDEAASNFTTATPD